VNRRRAALWSGTACIAAGLALVGYVGWQLVGTNIVAERRQDQLVERLEDTWAAGGSAGAGAGDTAQVAVGGRGPANALVRIPAFGDGYVMPVLEGVDDDNLSAGLAHFPGSAEPGGAGNYALAGHRVTHGEPLRDLPDLEPGDEVVVETRDRVYTYVVDTRPEDLVVRFDQTWVLDDRPANPDPAGVGPAPAARLLTLTTCAELFHTDDRMVVFGHLESARPRDTRRAG
jgi:sortase A